MARMGEYVRDIVACLLVFYIIILTTTSVIKIHATSAYFRCLKLSKIFCSYIFLSFAKPRVAQLL